MNEYTIPAHARPVHVSAVTAYKQCRLRYLWGVERGLRPRRMYEPFWVGSAFHKAIEEYDKHERPVLDTLQEFAAPDLHRANHEDAPEYAGEAEALYANQSLAGDLATYYLAWRKTITGTYAERSFTTIGTELPFAVPFPDDDNPADMRVYLSGRIDRLDRHEDGSLWIRDYKTCRSVSEMSNTIPYQEQPLIYMYAVYMLTGEWPTGVIYDLVGKNAHRLPEVLDSGMLSKKKIKTSHWAYHKAIKMQHGDELASDREWVRAHYGDILAKLRENTPSYFRRVLFTRPERIIRGYMRECHQIALEMNSPDRVITHSGGWHCAYCPFKNPCQLRLRGYDHRATLAIDFEVKPHNVHQFVLSLADEGGAE